MTQSDLVEFLLSEYGVDSEVEPQDDDCAVVQFGDRWLVATTDRTKTPPLAFELGMDDYRSWGRYLFAANVSDVLGTGGRPEGLLVNVTVPRNQPRTELSELARGVGEYAEQYECPIVGGDTKPGGERVVSGTAFGSATSESQLRTRAGAEPGDLVVLSGPVGGCYAGAVALEMLPPSLYDEATARDRILDPGLPVEANRHLRAASLGKGGIDISDGLGGDLHRLADRSDVGLEIWREEIPLDQTVAPVANYLDRDPVEFAFGFGGDWQFVATVAANRGPDLPDSVHVVGEVTKSGPPELVSQNARQPLPADAYDGFDHAEIIEMLA